MNNMTKEGQDLVTELNMTIDDLIEQKHCIIRQRDSVIDQAKILKNERNAMIDRNRELHKQLRDLQEELDKYKPVESLDDAMKREMLKYGHVLTNGQQEIDELNRQIKCLNEYFKYIEIARKNQFKKMKKEIDDLKSEIMRTWLDNGRKGLQPKI